MSATLDSIPSMIDRIPHDLVGLKMPRALEALDHVVRRVEHGELSALEAIDILLSEELTLRENSRIKTALRMGRLATIKTLAGFDFTFQPSLDRDRILTLAQLGFVDRHEAVHFLGPPGTGKSHLATALGVETVKAGKSVYFTTLADLIGSLARSEREGRLQDRIRFFCRPSLLIVDQIGYLPVVQGGGNLFFQLVNARYERGAMILTSNRGFAEWGDVFGDPVATALLDRLIQEMPNSRHSAAIFSPSRTRATNLRRSSMRLHSCQGTFALLAKAKSVTHVSGMNCHPSLGKDTHGSVEHPRRDFNKPIRRSARKAAAKNSRSFGQRLMDVDELTGPGMPRIQKLTNLRPVGVLSSCCTIISGPRLDDTCRVLSNNQPAT
ncbi:UNVERIFIED_ORG: DNA replication protein DnaC [Rhizobium etli]|uniref:Insertion sequence ATP-binding protein, IS21/IS1162 family n=2 Tax=Rhizobium TaxID=379 RepID=Q2K2F3_RHIEC|nr:putative insertion sequence ATP-binding protein, IS21/IS1162 family [Rhizobium etli CFN 42]PDT19189.1 IS21/IS1162 family insertion sequence ATP-binding protein [Rhizobium hidalgonense]